MTTRPPERPEAAVLSSQHAGPLCLACLRQEYAEQINRLVAEDREDLIAEVVAAYEEEALRAILGGEAAEAPPSPPGGSSHHVNQALHPPARRDPA